MMLEAKNGEATCPCDNLPVDTTIEPAIQTSDSSGVVIDTVRAGS